MGAHYRDTIISLNLEGRTLDGVVWGGGGSSVLLFERCWNVHLFNGTIDARGPGDGEHHHGVRFLNCRDVLFEDLTILVGTGDGVYISHDTPGGVGTGSQNVVGRRLRIQGSNIGRNGVSIICGRTILIEDVVTEGVTKPGFPGGIDLEPDWPGEYVDDVMIRRAHIHAGAGGALGGIVVANHIAHAPITRVYSEDCDITGPFNAGLRLAGSPRQNEEVTHIRTLVKGCRVNVKETEGKMNIVQPRFRQRKKKR